MDELFAAVSDFAWLVYLLTFALIFVETSGLPLPALSFALLAATLAGQGSLSFAIVVLATILGGTLGGPVGYSLGKRRGRPLLESIGGRVRITPERLDATQQQFDKRGKTIVLARFFVPILPWSAGIFAGIARMPRGTLVLFNFFSITLWALIELTIVAYFSSQLKDWLSRFSLTGAFWVATGAVGTFVLIRMFRRRRAAQMALRAGEQAQADVQPAVAQDETAKLAEEGGAEPITRA